MGYPGMTTCGSEVVVSRQCPTHFGDVGFIRETLAAIRISVNA
jgi:hypothetical protein